MTETPQLTERYGAPPRRIPRHLQRWGVVGFLAASFAAAVWFTIGMAPGQLEYQDVGYTIHSDTRATVDFEVTKDFDATAECMLHVLDDSYAIVGAKIVTVGPHEGSTAGERNQYLRSDLLTEYRGVSGVVDSCWLVD